MSFYESLKKSNLKTFSDLKKKAFIRRADGKIYKENISPELVYRRALILSKARPDVHLQTVLSVPIIDVPPALFREDGTRRRPTNKSDLLHLIENKVSEDVTCEPRFSGFLIYIVVAMAGLQSLNTTYMKTFEDVGQHFVKIFEKLLESFDEIH